MNIQTYRTNLTRHISYPVNRKNNSKLNITDPLPKEILRRKSHGTEQPREGIIPEKRFPDNAVLIIMKKFRGTLLTGKLNCDFIAADIFQAAR